MAISHLPSNPLVSRLESILALTGEKHHALLDWPMQVQVRAHGQGSPGAPRLAHTVTVLDGLVRAGNFERPISTGRIGASRPRRPGPHLGSASRGTELYPRCFQSMPLYFFDTDDGRMPITDDEGLELEGVQAARLQAQSALADIARDVVPGDGFHRTMTARVRDETGRTVLRATLVLTIEMEPD
jgi:hypothetical protein